VKLKTPWWKVVFHREPWNQHTMANTLDEFIDTHRIVSMFVAPMEFA